MADNKLDLYQVLFPAVMGQQNSQMPNNWFSRKLEKGRSEDQLVIAKNRREIAENQRAEVIAKADTMIAVMHFQERSNLETKKNEYTLATMENVKQQGEQTLLKMMIENSILKNKQHQTEIEANNAQFDFELKQKSAEAGNAPIIIKQSKTGND